jgi:hypothetical protein
MMARHYYTRIIKGLQGDNVVFVKESCIKITKRKEMKKIIVTLMGITFMVLSQGLSAKITQGFYPSFFSKTYAEKLDSSLAPEHDSACEKDYQSLALIIKFSLFIILRQMLFIRALRKCFLVVIR